MKYKRLSDTRLYQVARLYQLYERILVPGLDLEEREEYKKLYQQVSKFLPLK